MSAGKMRRVISIEAFTDTVNPAGTPVKDWVEKARLRAELLQQSASEFIRGIGATDEEVMVFRTRLSRGSAMLIGCSSRGRRSTSRRSRSRAITGASKSDA